MKAPHVDAPNEPSEIPDWVNSTPPDTSYTLTMYDENGGSVQQVEITRDEFLELKAHLATKRRYLSAEPAAA